MTTFDSGAAYDSASPYDPVPANGQYVFNGLTFGQGQTIDVESCGGLDEFPDVRSGDVAFPGSDGLLAGVDLLGGRTVTLGLIGSAGASTAPQLLDTVKQTFAPQRTGSSPLMFQWPGINRRILNCRPRKLSSTVVGSFTAGVVRSVVQLVAYSPLVYDADPTTVTGAVGDALSCPNNGNWPTAPLVTITGPVSNPVIVNATTGQAVAVNVAVNTGDRLVVDMDAHTADLNGSVRYALGLVPAWWTLPPGPNTVRVTSSGSSTGTVTVAYASAWL